MARLAGDPYGTVKTTATELGLDPKGPSEWAPFKMACPVKPAHGRSIVVADGIDGSAQFDASCGCSPAAVVRAMGLSLLDVMPPRTPPKTAPVPEPNGKGPTIVWTTLDKVPVRKLLWLWRPYMPLGKVVLIVGAPGHGKSQLTAWLAAQTTRGSFYDSDLREAGRVVVVSAEDDLGDTVVPRLLAAGADVSMVETVSVRHTYGFGMTADGLIKLPGNVELLHARLSRGDVRLCVFDPVASFIDRTHSALVNQDVRDVLDPLKAMAEQYLCTVVCILHVNKSSEIREWSARIAESHGFQAVARSILALGPDPDDDEGEAGSKKILAVPKSNLTKRTALSMRFAITSTTVYDGAGDPVETSRIEPVALCDVAADDLLMNDDQRSATREARRWLEDYLGPEWRKSGDVKRDAIKEGISTRTIERVQPTVCQWKRQGGRNGAVWLALKAVHTPPPWALGTGGVGDVGDLVDANTAKTARTPNGDVSVFDDNDAQDRQDRQDRQIDLDEYRRERDRRLGERDDDE